MRQLFFLLQLLLFGVVMGADKKKRYPEHLKLFPSLWVRIGECPLTSDGERQHYCPSATPEGNWVCVDDFQLCDGIKNCPQAEDESAQLCLFYRVLKTKVDTLTEAVSHLIRTIKYNNGEFKNE